MKIRSCIMYDDYDVYVVFYLHFLFIHYFFNVIQTFHFRNLMNREHLFNFYLHLKFYYNSLYVHISSNLNIIFYLYLVYTNLLQFSIYFHLYLYLDTFCYHLILFCHSLFSCDLFFNI